MKNHRRMVIIFTVLTAAIYMWPHSSHAKPELDDILDKMQERYRNIDTYKTAFEQTLTSAVFKKVIRHATGTIYYTRSGKIRWIYEKPDKHLFVIDGENFWDYDEAQKQVIKIPIKDALAGNVPQGFLFGAGNFKQDFDVKFKGHNKKKPHKGYMLTMTPRDEILQAVLTDLELLVSDDDYRVTEAKFVDAQGNTNHYTFTKSVMNPKLDPDMFIFKVPDGVKVILPAMPGEMVP